MPSYWESRASDSIGRMESAANGAISELVKSFESSKRDLIDQIERFYVRYAKDNKITLAEAQKVLSLAELRDFRGNLKEYERLARASIGTFDLQVANLSTKARITRLQALETQCDAILQALYQEQRRQIEGVAESVYTEQYYHRLFDVEQYTGFQFEFSKPSAAAIKRVIAQPIYGADISQHLWRQDIDTGFKIRSTLNQMFVTGKPPQYFADELQKVIGAVRVGDDGKVTGTGKKYEAYRLLYNEAAHANGQADLAAYQEDGLDEYEFIATLDTSTTEECRGHDGKHYPISEAVEGVNYPPLHVNCRSTTAPYIPDLKTTRMARDPVTGESVRTTAKNYEEWASAHEI